ncbi:Fe2OG dioxygenase domain-containing protein [Citrus sinensis]|uniref:Fe2OG dioxygenase domain-containing protein n=1 Tax=Citrus sinensis TaxID=2711 RepID=A0ACB8M192_CITSI|nr:Fe2OG dioxygenase domain-containing protein [Citrus sinensis]
MFIMSTLPIHLRDTLIGSLLNEVRTFSHESDIANGKSLNIKDQEMTDFSENAMQTPEKVIRLTPHSDGSTLTILLQVCEVEGLQIKKDGKWTSVSPLRNAFIVNIGDMFESINQWELPSASQERISISTFYKARYEEHPASSLISEETPALFRRVTVEEYLRGR